MRLKKLPLSALVLNCSKDDENVLVKALSSIWFCDQIVFLAHKSTSASLAIARKFGCDIYKWDEKPHMSNQRNYALSKCKHEFIVQCDSDEVFGWDTYGVIRELLQRDDIKDYTLFSFRLVNLSHTGEVMSIVPLQRMFRDTIRWSGSIQNQVETDNHEAVLEPRITVFHYGYGDPRFHAQKQWKRITYNEDMVREKPEEHFRRMYLINALTIAGVNQPLAYERLLANVCVNIEAYWDSPKELPDKRSLQKTMRFYYHSCSERGYYNQFIEKFTPLFEQVDYHLDCYHWMFVCYCGLQDEIKAITWGEKYLKKLKTLNKDMMTYNIEVTSANFKQDVIMTMIQIYEQKKPVDDKEAKYIKRQIRRFQKL